MAQLFTLACFSSLRTVRSVVGPAGDWFRRRRAELLLGRVYLRQTSPCTSCICSSFYPVPFSFVEDGEGQKEGQEGIQVSISHACTCFHCRILFHARFMPSKQLHVEETAHLKKTYSLDLSQGSIQGDGNPRGETRSSPCQKGHETCQPECCDTHALLAFSPP